MSVGPQPKPCFRYKVCRKMAPPGLDLCTGCAREFEVTRFGAKPKSQRNRYETLLVWGKAGMKSPLEEHNTRRARTRAKNRVARKQRKRNR